MTPDQLIKQKQDKEWYRKWYAKNREKKLANCKIWYTKNREDILRRDKLRNSKNKIAIALRNKIYRGKNKEKVARRKNEYYEKNKEKIQLGVKKWYKDNQDKVMKQRERVREHRRCYGKEYQARNRKRLQEYKNSRSQTVPEFKLQKVLRARMLSALKRNYKSGSAIADLGCTIPELKLHIEKQFKEGMTWENHGIHGWHIDHIKPLAEFNLSVRSQFVEAAHYTNLRPLWAQENWSKGKKHETKRN